MAGNNALPVVARNAFGPSMDHHFDRYRHAAAARHGVSVFPHPAAPIRPALTDTERAALGEITGPATEGGVPLAPGGGRAALRGLHSSLVDATAHERRDLRDYALVRLPLLVFKALAKMHAAGAAARRLDPGVLRVRPWTAQRRLLGLRLADGGRALVRLQAFSDASVAGADAFRQCLLANAALPRRGFVWSAPEEQHYWCEADKLEANARMHPGVLASLSPWPLFGPAAADGAHPAAKMDVFCAGLLALHLLRRCAPTPDPRTVPLAWATRAVAKAAVWPLEVEECEAFLDAELAAAFDPFAAREAADAARGAFRKLAVERAQKRLQELGAERYFTQRPTAAAVVAKFEALLRARS